MRLFQPMLAAALALLSAGVAVAAPSLPAPGSAVADERIRTQLVARESVVLSSELNAKVAQLALRDGDAFSAGQQLVRFDCALFEAQLRKAEASANAAAKLVEVNRRLEQLNSIGVLEVEQAEAKAKEAVAEAAYMRTTVSKCSVTAPFAGRVAKRIAAPHEFVTAGKPLLEIVDSEALEVQLIVPSLWLAWLNNGSTFEVHVDELNRSFTATVARIGARIDPVSQSIAVIGTIDGGDSKLLPGMSGWASFPVSN